PDRGEAAALRLSIAILLCGDYSRFAMGATLRRAATRVTTAIESAAIVMPARTSSQKWFAVASTQNQTQAGQSAQSAFDHQWRHARKQKKPTMSASPA